MYRPRMRRAAATAVIAMAMPETIDTAARVGVELTTT
jgi:hypothetical protein